MLDDVPSERVQWIVGAIEAALTYTGFSEAWVDLMIVDDTTMQQLNREYRNIDRTTDVLSFPQLEPEELQEMSRRPADSSTPDVPLLLGDVVLCWPRAVAQAREYGHSLQRELAFLAIHGTLHLLGYDHQTTEDEENMQQLTEEIIRTLEGYRE